MRTDATRDCHLKITEFRGKIEAMNEKWEDSGFKLRFQGELEVIRL